MKLATTRLKGRDLCPPRLDSLLDLSVLVLKVRLPGGRWADERVTRRGRLPSWTFGGISFIEFLLAESLVFAHPKGNLRVE